MKDMEQKVADRQAASDRNKKQGFQLCLERPETKMLLSLVPPGENPDVLLTLLETAYNAGFSGGQGDILSEMLDGMSKRGQI